LPEREFRCVGWNWGEQAQRLPVGATVDAVVRLRVSTYSGTARVEPEIVDVAIHPARGQTQPDAMSVGAG
jgi:hypothetical protein